MKVFTTSEIVKGSVFMMSVMDHYQDICDILAQLFRNSSDFLNLNECDKKIVIADRRIHQTIAYGDVRLNMCLLAGKAHTVIVSGVLFVRSFRYSLVSESCLDGK